MAGDQVDHAPNGTRAVQAGHGAAHDLDPLDILQRVDAEIERAARIARIVDGDAVTQHQHVIGVGTADEHAGLAAGAARLHDAQARHGAERIDQADVAALLDGAAVDDGHAGRKVCNGARNTRRGDGDVFRRIGVGLRIQGARKDCGQGSKKQDTHGRKTPHTPRARSAGGVQHGDCRMRVFPTASVHPARRARTVSTPAGLLARAWSPLPRESWTAGPAFSPLMRQWLCSAAKWRGRLGPAWAAYSCGGSCGTSPHSRFSPQAGHLCLRVT